MESSMCVISCKQSDYVVCNNCSRINWYENEKCVECKEVLVPHKSVSVEDWVESEYDYWRDEGFPEYWTDELRVEV